MSVIRDLLSRSPESEKGPESLVQKLLDQRDFITEVAPGYIFVSMTKQEGADKKQQGLGNSAIANEVGYAQQQEHADEAEVVEPAAETYDNVVPMPTAEERIETTGLSEGDTTVTQMLEDDARDQRVADAQAAIEDSFDEIEKEHAA